MNKGNKVKQIVRMIKKGKTLEQILNVLLPRLEKQDEINFIEIIPCDTCDRLEDDNTCPDCNGEGEKEVFYPFAKGFNPKESYFDDAIEVLMNIPEYVDRLKNDKLLKLEHLEVQSKRTIFDAHTRARNDMANVIALANYDFIKSISELDPRFKEKFDTIYKKDIQWKAKNNKPYKRKLIEIAQMAKEAYGKYAKILGL